MLRLIVLLTAVVCCIACRLDMVEPQDTTNSPKGCSDSDGNHHEFDSEWEHGHEICVCVSFGIICCERLESTIPPETIAEIFYDDFGAFTEGDHGEPEAPSILESTIPPETIAEIFYDDFGAFTEGDHGEPEAPSISDEEHAIPEVPPQLDSTDSPEAKGNE